MKKHAIIPIFIPHLGCENDCVFCNQKIITAKSDPVSPNDAEQTILEYLSTLRVYDDIKKCDNPPTVEIAFYGGSFTGLDIETQNKYLDLALKYKRLGKIDKIHMSTRPDYINSAILDNLKAHQVDIIELGVQSFDEAVLKASKRGHKISDIYYACNLIKTYGFSLGIQLMIGLPNDSKEKSIESARLASQIQPDIARLYPTLVLPDTELFEMMKLGKYSPLSQKDAIEICKEMYKILTEKNINIIRVGLKSSDLINFDNPLLSNYHPAFRQLVEGEIARESIDCQLDLLNSVDITAYTLSANPKSFSNLIGHKAKNRYYFEKKLSNIKLNFRSDSSIPIGKYKINADIF